MIVGYYSINGGEGRELKDHRCRATESFGSLLGLCSSLQQLSQLIGNIGLGT